MLDRFGIFVAPPLCPFPVGTAHIRIAHGHVERAEGFLPKSIIEILIAFKATGKVGVVPGFSVFQVQHLYTLRNGIPDLVAVHPTLIFVGLDAVFGDIFRPYVRGAAPAVIVRPDVDFFAGRGLSTK
jgi:hypothetical protein